MRRSSAGLASSGCPLVEGLEELDVTDVKGGGHEIVAETCYAFTYIRSIDWTSKRTLPSRRDEALRTTMTFGLRLTAGAHRAPTAAKVVNASRSPSDGALLGKPPSRQARRFEARPR
jgi:hypothetical protein